MRISIKYLFIIIPAIALFMCLTAGVSFAQHSLKIIIIRHAEKPAQGDNLSCAGMDRALKLTAVLVARFGTPNFLYAAAPSLGKATKSMRMLQTISPLAIKYNLPVNTNYSVEQTKGLAANIIKKSGNVVVVWEHNELPQLLTALGVNAKKFKWKSDDFDSIWIVSVNNGKITFEKSSQGIKPVSNCTF